MKKLLEKLNTARYDVEPVTDNPTFHPGRGRSLYDKTPRSLRCSARCIPPSRKNYEIGGKGVYIAQIDLENGVLINTLPQRDP